MELFNSLADHGLLSMGSLSTSCLPKELYHLFPLFFLGPVLGLGLAPFLLLCSTPVPRPVDHRGNIIFNDFENLSASGRFFFSSSSLLFILIFSPLAWS